MWRRDCPNEVAGGGAAVCTCSAPAKFVDQHSHHNIIVPDPIDQSGLTFTTFDHKTAFFIGADSSRVDSKDTQRNAMQCHRTESMAQYEPDRLGTEALPQFAGIVDANCQCSAVVCCRHAMQPDAPDQPADINNPSVLLALDRLHPLLGGLARRGACAGRLTAVHADNRWVVSESLTCGHIIRRWTPQRDAWTFQYRQSCHSVFLSDLGTMKRRTFGSASVRSQHAYRASKHLHGFCFDPYAPARVQAAARRHMRLSQAAEKHYRLAPYPLPRYLRSRFCAGALLVSERAAFPPRKHSRVGNSRSLPFPKVTAHAALPLRTERHVPNSIASLRIELAAGLATTLERCTGCAQSAAPLKFAA